MDQLRLEMAQVLRGGAGRSTDQHGHVSPWGYHGATMGLPWHGDGLHLIDAFDAILMAVVE